MCIQVIYFDFKFLSWVIYRKRCDGETDVFLDRTLVYGLLCSTLNRKKPENFAQPIAIDTGDLIIRLCW